MPSPEASRRNLKLAQNPWTERSRDESLLNWKLTFDWWMQGERREPRTQAEWARVLGVRQSYVAKMVSRFESELRTGDPKWHDRVMSWAPATLEDLRRAREVRKRVRARLAEEQEWEQYDAEQRREQYAEPGDVYEDETEQPPAPAPAQPEPRRLYAGEPLVMTAEESIAETWREVGEWKRKNLWRQDTRRRIWVPVR